MATKGKGSPYNVTTVTVIVQRKRKGQRRTEVESIRVQRKSSRPQRREDVQALTDRVFGSLPALAPPEKK